MLYNKINRHFLYIKKELLVILLGHCIYCIGDAFHAIGITFLLIRITNSGLAAGFELLCIPAATIILFPLSLKVVDKLQEKYFMTLLSIIRLFIGLCFMRVANIVAVYVLIILNASVNIFYNPVIKKSLKNATDSKGLVTAHSLLNSVTGIAYLVAPAVAGFIVKCSDIDFAWIISSSIFAFSAFVIYQIPTPIRKLDSAKIYRDEIENIYTKDALSYYMSNPNIKELVLVNALVHFSIASVNLAFYVLAFDIMNAPSHIWGFIMSIYNGASLMVFLVPFLYSKQDRQYIFISIYRSIFCLAVPWLIYGFIHRWSFIFIGLLVEGIAQALFNVFLTSRLQLLTESKFLGGIMVINDMMASIGTLISIAITYYYLEIVSYRIIFFINFFILLIFSAYKARSSLFKSQRTSLR